MLRTHDVTLTSLTSSMSPTSRFFVSEPEPFVSAGGPVLVEFHGEEIVLAKRVPPGKTKQKKNFFK